MINKIDGFHIIKSLYDSWCDYIICSLNGKNYNKKEIVVGDGYELVKLDDIADFFENNNILWR